MGKALSMLAMALLLALLMSACQRTTPPVSFHAEGRPEKLSDWHLLATDGRRLTLNTGVLPFDLNSGLFSDHAHKLRTVWMPPGSAAHYHPEDAFDFPEGTILSKTFYYPRAEGAALRQTGHAEPDVVAQGLDLSRVRLVETRLLVRRADGWVAMPYVWNAEQTEATLERTGDLRPVELVDDSGRRQRFTYVVPDENQCAACHVVDLKQKAFLPLGPKARHLNRRLDYAEGPENQLVRWQRQGYLAGLPGTPPDTTTLPRAADWQDAQAPLADRARAYLDINCAHCHQPRATASNTALRLDALAPVDWQMGLCKSPVAAGKGTGDRLFGIEPGQPDASIMAFRMASTQGGVMMPELGRSTVHDEGLLLVRQWIASLPGRCQGP
jgi:uncharacterized repeat protein (TIGR03806 family)